jgi:RNA recognition motif-containing protein
LQILRDESTGDSLGYGIVDYYQQSSAASAKSALANSIQKGRNLRVDWADCRDYRSMLAHILFIDKYVCC